MRSYEHGDLQTVIVRPPWFYGPFQPAAPDAVPRRRPSRPVPARRRRHAAAFDGVHRQPRPWHAAGRDGGQGARQRVLDRRRASRTSCARSSTRSGPRSPLRGSRSPTRRPIRVPALVGSMAEAADKFVQERGRYVQAVHVLGELKDTIACDISRARDELGYEPPIALLEGMRREHPLVPRERRAALMGRTVLVTGGSGYFGTVLAEPGARARRSCSRLRPERRPSPPMATSSTSRAMSATEPRYAPRATAPMSSCTTSRKSRWQGTARCSTRSTSSARPTCSWARAMQASPRSCTPRRARSFGIPESNPVRRGLTVPAARGLRPSEVAGRAAVPRSGGGRPRRHDRPAADDPRPRPARHLRRPVRVRRRRRTGVRAWAGRQPLPARPRGRSRRRLPACRRPARLRAPTTSAPVSSARCARRSKRSSTTPATGLGHPFAAHRRGEAGDAGPGHGRAGARSPRTTGCCTASRCTSTPPRPATELGWAPRHSNASMLIESYDWYLAHRDDSPSHARTTSHPSGSAP